MIALDTNILVHAHRKDASLHEKANAVVKQLAESPAAWGICYHSLVEFYGVVTRLGVWNRPSTPEEATNQMNAWRESPSFRIINDTEDSFAWLLQMVVDHRISGAMVHDARIAACCMSYGVQELWTVDRDFSRFTNLVTRNPL